MCPPVPRMHTGSLIESAGDNNETYFTLYELLLSLIHKPRSAFQYRVNNFKENTIKTEIIL